MNQGRSCEVSLLSEPGPMRRRVTTALVLGAVACGGATDTDVRTRSGPTRFAGTSAWVFSGPWSGVADPADAGQSINLFELLISDVPVPCSASGGNPPMFAAVNVSIYTQAPDQVVPGTHVFDGQVDFLWFYYLWQGQPESPVIPVSSGRLELRRLDESGAEGSVDLILTDDTHLEGRFSAERCP